MSIQTTYTQARANLAKLLDEVTLNQEIVIIKQYLDIEKIRFQKRLTYNVNIPEKYYLHKIPDLLLQPLRQY